MFKAFRVLLVEDNPGDERLLRELIGEVRRFSFPIVHADSLARGLACLDEQHIDVVLLDLGLPDSTGLETFVKFNNHASSVPILILTGLDDEELGAEAVHLGAQDYLVKGQFDSDLLAHSIRYAIERKFAQELLKSSHHFLEIANRHRGLDELLGEIVAEIHAVTHCSAVAVRLNTAAATHIISKSANQELKRALNLKGSRSDSIHNVIYVTSLGFDDTFIAAEEAACNEAHISLAHEVLAPHLTQLPISKHGTFTVESCTTFQAKDERVAQMLAFYRDAGFETLALIPIHIGSANIGVLQLADAQPALLSLPTLQMLEGAALELGQAVQRLNSARGLRESEELYRTLLETSPDAQLLVGTDGEIFTANQQASELLGIANKGHLIGQSLYNYVAQIDAERFFHNFALLLNRQQSQRFECSLLQVNGQPLIAELSCGLIHDAGGETKAIMVVARDLTERKQMQAQLSQADRLASVGVLAAGVAHEINNPLTFILSNLENLSEQFGEFITAGRRATPELEGLKAAEPLREYLRADFYDDVQSSINDAVEGARRVSDIVSGLKTFSRIDEQQLEELALHDLIDQVLKLTSNELRYRARVVKDYNQLPPIQGSKGSLAQALINLIVNAAHAIEEGHAEKNEITVRTETVGDEVLISIRDSGHGIKEEHKGRLFEPFFTTKPVGSGIGLGLSISHNIIKAHGGRIEVESKFGKGSTFTIHLPLKGKQIRSREPVNKSTAVANANNKGRILVIDDEPLICATIKRVLRNEHEVVAAESGSAAQALLSEDNTFDVVLCDIMMPDLSGIELFQWLKQHHPNLEPRVVFITGGAFTPKAREFLEQTTARQLQKPFKLKEFKSILKELLAEQDPLQQT